jgi:hypothetical protein
MTGAFSLLICGDFQLVATNIHTASPPSSPLARVEEVKNAGFAFAKAGRLSLREMIGRFVHDRRPEVEWPIDLLPEISTSSNWSLLVSNREDGR